MLPAGLLQRLDPGLPDARRPLRIHHAPLPLPCPDQPGQRRAARLLLALAPPLVGRDRRALVPGQIAAALQHRPHLVAGLLVLGVAGLLQQRRPLLAGGLPGIHLLLPGEEASIPGAVLAGLLEQHRGLGAALVLVRVEAQLGAGARVAAVAPALQQGAGAAALLELVVGEGEVARPAAAQRAAQAAPLGVGPEGVRHARLPLHTAVGGPPDLVAGPGATLVALLLRPGQGGAALLRGLLPEAVQVLQLRELRPVGLGGVVVSLAGGGAVLEHQRQPHAGRGDLLRLAGDLEDLRVPLRLVPASFRQELSRPPVLGQGIAGGKLPLLAGSTPQVRGGLRVRGGRGQAGWRGGGRGCRGWSRRGRRQRGSDRRRGRRRWGRRGAGEEAPGHERREEQTTGHGGSFSAAAGR